MHRFAVQPPLLQVGRKRPNFFALCNYKGIGREALSYANRTGGPAIEQWLASTTAGQCTNRKKYSKKMVSAKLLDRQAGLLVAVRRNRSCCYCRVTVFLSQRPRLCVVLRHDDYIPFPVRPLALVASESAAPISGHSIAVDRISNIGHCLVRCSHAFDRKSKKNAVLGFFIICFCVGRMSGIM